MLFARGVATVGRWAVPLAPLQLVCVAASATNLLMAANVRGAAARKPTRFGAVEGLSA